VRTEQTARHEDGERHTLGISDWQSVAEVVAVAIIEGHDNSGSTRWNGQVVEGRWFASPYDLLEVGGKILGTDTKPKGILDAFGYPVVAEDQRSVIFHGAQFPSRNAARTCRDRLNCPSPRVATTSPPITAHSSDGQLGLLLG